MSEAKSAIHDLEQSNIKKVDVSDDGRRAIITMRGGNTITIRSFTRLEALRGFDDKYKMA